MASVLLPSDWCKRTRKTATLLWRAPGDNGVSNGKVRGYEVYHSGKAVGVGNLNRAARLKAPRAARPGQIQKLAFRLPAKRQTIISIRSRDAAGNWSSLSRVRVKPYRRTFSFKQRVRKCQVTFKRRLRKVVRRSARRGKRVRPRQIRALKRQRVKCVRTARRAARKAHRR